MMTRRSILWLIAAFLFALTQGTDAAQRSLILGTATLTCMVLCFIGMLVAMESGRP